MASVVCNFLGDYFFKPISTTEALKQVHTIDCDIQSEEVSREKVENLVGYLLVWQLSDINGFRYA